MSTEEKSLNFIEQIIEEDLRYENGEESEDSVESNASKGEDYY